MADGPEGHDPTSLAFLTQAEHAGNSIDAGSGAIRTPLVFAISYALPDDPASVTSSTIEHTVLPPEESLDGLLALLTGAEARRQR